MKLCQCCNSSAEDDANSCKNCGEGSWSERAPLPAPKPPRKNALRSWEEYKKEIDNG